MDQIKIGAFISQRRKEKGWTQTRLAEELGITDKAVSKWETGRSMPDLSLLSPLCTLLEITLNELFAGERIPEPFLKKKADEILMEVITNWLGVDRCGKREEGGAPSVPVPVLEVQNISKVYQSDSGPVPALNDVSFQIHRGSFVGIMGASGSGKTTLNLIATIDKPSVGAIWLNGKNIADIPEEDRADFRRGHLGFVFQEYNLLDTLTIYENIALALTIKEIPRETVEKIVLDTAERLNISSILDQFPYEVSGGQRQRCACARAIAVNPDIILADEPTGALDSHAARQLLDTFSTLCREDGATILMVTHDVMAASCCDRILFMQDGEIKAALDRNGEDKQVFFADILKKLQQTEGENRDLF